MRAVGWLLDGTEASLRAALATAAPELAALPLTINPRHAGSNPLYWSTSAVLDRRFVVKYAWSEIRAARLWREGVVLARLKGQAPVPEVVALSRDPALVATRLVVGQPLTWAWAGGLTSAHRGMVAGQLAEFLGRLHGIAIDGLLGHLPVVAPTPQSSTESLRARFPELVDRRRAALVLRWCDWVDEVLVADHGGVFVHGDLHGYNQVWDHDSTRLLTVVDFEECGVADPHYDLRYLPTNAPDLALTLAVIDAYEHVTGRRLAIDRVMAWHALTHLGDAMWRTEAGVALPGGGDAATYVDDLSVRLASLELPGGTP